MILYFVKFSDGSPRFPFRPLGIAEFPHEETGIRKYFAAIQAQQATAGLFFASKVIDSLLPDAVGRLLVPLLSAAYGGSGLMVPLHWPARSVHRALSLEILAFMLVAC